MEKTLANSIVKSDAKHQLPVEVIGADYFGQQFFEEAKTATIYRTGVSILMENRLSPDTEVILRNPKTGDEAHAFVLGQMAEKRNGHVYGLAIVETASNLWRIEFAEEEAPKTIRLECGGCHAVQSHTLSEIESEIFETTRKLTRTCHTCKSSQTWKATDREASEKKTANFAGRADFLKESEPIPEAPRDSSSEDRRKNRRAGMKISACIRFCGAEHVVSCEDISKGGFRFIGPREYPGGTRLEVAAPYTQSSTNIFTSASIIYCHKMPNGQFRHGASYTKNRGSVGWDS